MKNTKTQSATYKRLLERYLKGYITDSQLDRYVSLGQITVEEAEMIRLEKQYQDGTLERPTTLPEVE